MRINHNISALNTYRQMGANQGAAAKNMEKLSSGLRINRAGDDAAGLAISEKMRGQIRGLDMASKNAQDGISLIQTAEGALNETHSILQRMRELSVQAANDTNTVDDRAELQKEVTQLKAEINRISTDTEFNTKTLLNGDLTNSGAGAVQEKATIDLSELTAKLVTTPQDVVIKLGDTNVTIKADGSAATGSTPVVNGTANTITIGTDAGATVEDIIAGFSLLAAADSESDAAQFTYTGDTATTAELVITAKTDGKFAGTNGNGKIVTSDVAYDVTAGANGTNGEVKLHIGANDGQNMTIAIQEISSDTLGSVANGYVRDIDLTTQTGADSALKTLDDAIKQVSEQRSDLGAFQNRLEHTINNLGTSSENLTAAESRIRDVDMAKEMMEMTKNNILQQAAQAMLAQANQQPQGVLQLLR